ncbi:MAG: PEP-CTERM sorting domain-containing protein [Cyanobacteria bacterium P01_F01_bin.150]
MFQKSLIALSATALVIGFAGSVEAATFSQTQTAIERDVDRDRITDPFTFNFTSLPPIASAASSFTLDLSFAGLDLNSSSEFLGTLVNNLGQSFDLGRFDFTRTSGNIFNSSGNGSKTVQLSQVGGTISNPFSVVLTPSINVDPFRPRGFVDLTLSYETGDASAIPEPMTIIGTLAAVGVGTAIRKRKQQLDQESA